MKYGWKYDQFQGQFENIGIEEIRETKVIGKERMRDG